MEQISLDGHHLKEKKEPEFAWLNDVSSVPLQQALRHQQAATFTDVTFKYRDG